MKGEVEVVWGRWLMYSSDEEVSDLYALQRKQCSNRWRDQVQSHHVAVTDEEVVWYIPW